MDLKIYTDTLIGRPWSADGMHCWELVRTVRRDLFGDELPPVAAGFANGGAGVIAMAFANNPERANWRPVEKPRHGSIVMMSRKGSAGAELHAGIYLVPEHGQPFILHSHEQAGVMPSYPAELRLQWQRVEYFDRA